MPEFGAFDAEAVAEIDLTQVPLLPTLSETAQDIFERGLEAGRDPAIFSKVGDSMTASESFLVGFGTGEYDLGEYETLQPVVDFVLSAADDEASAFDRVNYATALGFSTVSALDPTWADADVCDANETPLLCEYRVSNAAIALVMFGTNDVAVLDPASYDFFLRSVVIETINADVLPVLYTFPIRADVPMEKSITFNQIIVSAAQDYNVPLINLNQALVDLPNYGVQADDPLHLTLPDDPKAVFAFTDETLSAGYTIRNLLTLQALNHLLTELEILTET